MTKEKAQKLVWKMNAKIDALRSANYRNEREIIRLTEEVYQLIAQHPGLSLRKSDH